MSTAAELEAVEAGFRALQQGDPEPLIRLLDPAVRWHAVPGSGNGPCIGRAQAADQLRGAADQAPDVDARFRVAGQMIVVELAPAEGRPVPDLLRAAPAAGEPRLWITVETHNGSIVRIEDSATEPAAS